MKNTRFIKFLRIGLFMIFPLVLFSCSDSQLTNTEEIERSSIQVDKAETPDSFTETDDLWKWRKSGS
jgi:hypothetical protein